MMNLVESPENVKRLVAAGANISSDAEPADLGDFVDPSSVVDHVFYRLIPTPFADEHEHTASGKRGKSTGRIVAMRATPKVSKELIVYGDGTVSKGEDAKRGTYFRYEAVTVETLDDVEALLAPKGNSYIVPGALIPGKIRQEPIFKNEPIIARRDSFQDTRRAVMLFDVDDVVTPLLIPSEAAEYARDNFLPEPFKGIACAFSATRSHGLDGRTCLRLGFVLDRPLLLAQQRVWAATSPKLETGKVCPSIYGVNQPIFTNVRIKLEGGAERDAFTPRVGQLPGGQAVVHVPETLPTAKAARAYDRTVGAPVNYVENDSVSLHRLLTATEKRDTARIDSDGGRHKSMMYVALDAADLAISDDLALAILRCWVYADDDAETNLALALADAKVSEPDWLASQLRRAGEKVRDRMAENGALDDDDLEDMIEDGYNLCKQYGHRYKPQEDGADAGAADVEGNEIESVRERAAKVRADHPEYSPEYADKQARRQLGEEAAAAEAAKVEADTDDTDDATDQSTAPAMSAAEAVEHAVATGDQTAAVAILGKSDPTKERAVSLSATRLFDAGFFGWPDKHNDRDYLDALAAAADKPKAKAFIPAPVYIENPDRLAPRPFIFNEHYARKFVSLTTAPGGRGKSSLLLAEAVCMATGVTLDGKPTRPLRCCHYSLEDPLDEIELRLGAIQKHKRLPPDAFGDRLYVLSGREHPLKIVESKKGAPAINQKAVDRLIELITTLKLDVLQLDPLVSLTTAPENDTVAMDLLVKELGRIAGATNTAVMVANHVRKPARDSEGLITSSDSRGAGAMVDGVRNQRLLNPMLKREAEELGVAEDDRWRYIRSGGPEEKANLRPKGSISWFKLESQGLDNSTEEYEASNVQVIVAWDAPAVAAKAPRETSDDRCEALARVLAKTPGAYRPLGEVGAEAGIESLSDKTTRKGTFDRLFRGADAVETLQGRLVARKVKGVWNVCLQTGEREQGEHSTPADDQA